MAVELVSGLLKTLDKNMSVRKPKNIEKNIKSKQETIFNCSLFKVNIYKK